MITMYENDLPCTLVYGEHSSTGLLMESGGKVGKSFIVRRPSDESFWLSLPKNQLEGSLLVNGVSYKAIFSVSSTVPIHTLSVAPPCAITSITGRIIDENFKPV